MRESGVLLHISSLPGNYGIGAMGRRAFEFVDFLHRAGQRYWQILPLTPTGYGDSPYQSCSTFAGNPYLIDLEALIDEGLLTQSEVENICWCDTEDRVDYGALYGNKIKVLRLAYGRFSGSRDFEEFCVGNSHWLPDFALYMALKDANKGKAWYTWEDGLKFRQPDAVWKARQTCRDEIRFYSFVQFIFYSQWGKLRNYAHDKQIKVIGDVPIYVPYDSVEVWVDAELFQLDTQLCPVSVAGCPPDSFSEDGQLWGNPLYRWDRMKNEGYRWWLRRMDAAGKLYDVVRLDHFRGFESYWSVPFGELTARNGRWIKGPGIDFIRTLQTAVPNLRLIAEDLGTLTDAVYELLEESGLPGMKVLEFAFDSREPSPYLPHNHTPNSVCYTGTHDNMTVQQWLETAPADTVAYATEYMRLSDEEGKVWGVIRTALSSVSELCILPMQDLLGLGGEARMNFPGTLTQYNWTWRLNCDIISGNLADRLRELTCLYGRHDNQQNEETEMFR